METRLKAIRGQVERWAETDARRAKAKEPLVPSDCFVAIPVSVGEYRAAVAMEDAIIAFLDAYDGSVTGTDEEMEQFRAALADLRLAVKGGT